MTYVPLSVRYGNRRKRLGWWWKGRREAVALRLCPWLKPMSMYDEDAGYIEPDRARELLRLPTRRRAK